MWNKEFEKQIFESLQKIPGKHINDCYKAFCDNTPYFIKKINIRFHENVESAQERIEQSERINKHFNDNGIETVLAVSFDGCYTHRINENIWIAYHWEDIQSIKTVDEKLCYDMGYTLHALHSVQSDFEFTNEQNVCYKPDFHWVKYARLAKDVFWEPFLKVFDELKKYSEYGNKCANILSSDTMNVLSHGDFHEGNVFYKDGNLVILDWELSGCINPYIELLDTALNLAGFCQCKTNLSHFSSVIKGYNDYNNTTISYTHIESVVGYFYLMIIERMCQYLNECLKEKTEINLLEAHKYLNQFHELKKHSSKFLYIIYNN